MARGSSLSRLASRTRPRTWSPRRGAFCSKSAGARSSCRRTPGSTPAAQCLGRVGAYPMTYARRCSRVPTLARGQALPVLAAPLLPPAGPLPPRGPGVPARSARHGPPSFQQPQGRPPPRTSSPGQPRRLWLRVRSFRRQRRSTLRRRRGRRARDYPLNENRTRIPRQRRRNRRTPFRPTGGVSGKGTLLQRDSPRGPRASQP